MTWMLSGIMGHATSKLTKGTIPSFGGERSIVFICTSRIALDLFAVPPQTNKEHST